MFGRKQERVRRALAADEAPPITHKIEPITGPLADLCRDIRENPGRYEFDVGMIKSKDDHGLWIGCGYAMSCFQSHPSLAEQDAMRKAGAAFTDYEKVRKSIDLTARLAKLKAAREKKAEIKPPEDIVRRLDLDTPGASADAGSLTADRLKRALMHSQIVWPSALLWEAASQLLPVLEGTHRIVPVSPVTIETATPRDDRPVMRDFLTDPAPVYAVHSYSDIRWTDKSGKHHLTRAAMRAANKLIEAKRRKHKAEAP